MIRSGWFGLILAVSGLVSGIAPVGASPVDEAADRLLAMYPASPLLVIGETHGTRETPALVGALAERLAAMRELIVALEIDMEMQPQLDAWLASDGRSAARDALVSAPFWQAPLQYSDGRRSEAKRDLLVQLRALRTRHPTLQVRLIDTRAPGHDPRAAREEGMAQALRAVRKEAPDATILVLVGNYHAMRHALPSTNNATLGFLARPSMMSTLSDLDPVTVSVSARRGTYWACTAGGCGVKHITAKGSDGDEATVDALTAQDPYHATVGLPSFEASPPVVPPSSP